MTEATPIRPAEQPVNQSVVEMLEALLERAKSGEIIAICGVSRACNSEFAEFYSDSALAQVIPFLGYIRVLQMRFEREVEM